MNAKDENVAQGLNRLNAVFAWWGVPDGNSGLDRQMKCCQALVSDLQKAYSDACSRQMGAPLATNDRISRLVRDFLGCRRPQDVIAVQSNVAATVLEEASSQAKVWAELTQKVQGCFTAMARETADELRKQSEEENDTKPATRVVKAPDGDANRHRAAA
jgi:hypothetical protein